MRTIQVRKKKSIFFLCGENSKVTHTCMLGCAYGRVVKPRRFWKERTRSLIVLSHSVVVTSYISCLKVIDQTTRARGYVEENMN